jgi:hypothetical protein
VRARYLLIYIAAVMMYAVLIGLIYSTL